MFSLRSKLLRGAAIATLAAGALGATPIADARATHAQVPLDSHTIPQFVQKLPLLDVSGGSIQTVDGTAASTTIRMCEFEASPLPPGALGHGREQPKTVVWGYYAGSSCPRVRDTYTGPVILAKRRTPTKIDFVNQLGSTSTSRLLAYKNSVDQTIMWADPLNGEMNACDTKTIPTPGSPCSKNYSGTIPAVVHLHGGEVPPEVDGEPDAWFTADGRHQGPSYYSAPGVAGNSDLLTYPNTQPAAPLWFHDHTMGATRLNVYAGLAGAYLLADDSLSLPAGMAEYGLTNRGHFEPTIPLVIQDRMFDTRGQLYFPAGPSGGIENSPNPDHPYWVPEFIGDTILVNGKAWPYLNVEQKRYRFLFLDGSNARGYSMSLVDPVSGNPGPTMWVVATDGGYLDKPVPIDENALFANQLTMLPGERYEVMVDFSGYGAGVRGANGKRYSGHWLLTNSANAPLPSGDPVDPATTGRIMEFNVGPCTSHACGWRDTSYDPAAGWPILKGSDRIVRLVNPEEGALAEGVAPAKTRELTLNEIEKDGSTAVNPANGKLTSFDGGPLEVVLNNSPYDGGSDMSTGTCKRSDFTKEPLGMLTLCVSESPNEGDTEVWEIVNLTMDAHPIHMHLVQFQLMNRQSFDVDKYDAAYGAAFPSGDYQPEFGPPLSIAPSAASAGKWGGNPDVTPFLTGDASAPTPQETGWKDTVIALPGQVTRFVVRFAPTDVPVNAAAAQLAYPFDPSGGGVRGYVWHCHIVDHEDNEMMRPYMVVLNPYAPAAASRPLVKGTDY